MKNDRIYIEHIIDCIDRIDEYTQNDSFVFMNSTMVQDAVIRNLQTLSESTQKLSDELKAEHPEINWKAISGFRNILVHNYLGLDLPQIWIVIENRLPLLRENLEKLL
ncbi:HepT-like ribonuclease domain-containing protein [Methylovulum miyakonense]|uniref:HepT-like ribonuclease domain-containing protein n=1 Tax=Methylovulum miyakonense TaxID=645578 RepID=UPI000372FB25|nr:HepT-like ribonuclease domain-containing protein [Methylovulum miyakonense]